VDPFAVVVIVCVLVAAVAAVFSAKASAGKPLSEFGSRAVSRLGAAASGLDEQDLEELLAATNARRRARGQTERSLSDAIREFEAD
jgi:hypothetical protein